MELDENLSMYVTLRLKISDAVTLIDMIESNQDPRDVFNEIFEMDGYGVFDDTPNHVIAVEILKNGITLINLEVEEGE